MSSWSPDIWGRCAWVIHETLNMSCNEIRNCNFIFPLGRGIWIMFPKLSFYYLIPYRTWQSILIVIWLTLLWRHNGRDDDSNIRRFDCLLKRMCSCRSKKTSKFCVTGFCEGNSAVTGTKGQQSGKCLHLMTSSWNSWVFSIFMHKYFPNTSFRVFIFYTYSLRCHLFL